MTVPTVLGVGPNSFKPNELITFSLSLGSEKKSLRKSEMIKDFFFFCHSREERHWMVLIKRKVESRRQENKTVRKPG